MGRPLQDLSARDLQGQRRRGEPYIAGVNVALGREYIDGCVPSSPARPPEILMCLSVRSPFFRYDRRRGVHGEVAMYLDTYHALGHVRAPRTWRPRRTCFCSRPSRLHLSCSARGTQHFMWLRKIEWLLKKKGK